ncbi:MAG: hypothetical protein ACI91O_000039 [Candidatus Poriferisodalaceae bacterium]
MIADRQGVPAVSVMTTAFVDAAEAMARVQGVPDHPFAIIEHPISSADEEGLIARAQAAVDRIVEVLVLA